MKYPFWDLHICAVNENGDGVPLNKWKKKEIAKRNRLKCEFIHTHTLTIQHTNLKVKKKFPIKNAKWMWCPLEM